MMRAAPTKKKVKRKPASRRPSHRSSEAPTGRAVSDPMDMIRMRGDCGSKQGKERRTSTAVFRLVEGIMSPGREERNAPAWQPLGEAPAIRRLGRLLL